MFGSIVLDVVIGMVFIYLLYSLLATIMGEMIANLLSLRPMLLARSIRRMLEDKPGIDSLSRFLGNLGRYVIGKNDYTAFSDQFYQHKAIRSLHSRKLFGWLPARPSYISAELFANTLIRLLRKNGEGGSPSAIVRNGIFDQKLNIAPETRAHLHELLEEAQDDLEKFNISLQDWFNDMQKQTTGWFKQWMQIILLVIGFLIAWQFNVDSIAIAKKLSKDKGAREQMVKMATAGIEKLEPYVDSLYKDDPLGKDKAKVKLEFLLSAGDSVKKEIQKANSILAIKQGEESKCPLNILGWLLTALAISLGAPFWFDLLNKLVKIRSVVQQNGGSGGGGSDNVSIIQRKG